MFFCQQQNFSLTTKLFCLRLFTIHFFLILYSLDFLIESKTAHCLFYGIVKQKILLMVIFGELFLSAHSSWPLSCWVWMQLWIVSYFRFETYWCENISTEPLFRVSELWKDKQNVGWISTKWNARTLFPTGFVFYPVSCYQY